MASFMADNSSSPSNSWPLDQFVQDPGYLAYQEELRFLIFNTAQTAAPSREASPTLGNYGPTDEELAAQAQTKTALASGRRLEYLKNYVVQLDMFDSNGAFTVQVPVLARSCPALLYAMLALSARQMERKEARQHSFDSLELYQEAIRLLNPLPQAVFWCYARMDLCGALISDGTQGTLVPLDNWLPPGSDPNSAADIFRDHRSPDMHANYSVYLCSKVCELIADRTHYVELGENNGCDSATFERR
ncbi:C6 zinc finger domain containing protein [Fusarium agapanthi]|uniref:C6 zinc finger domain containing protein n=1 Tax=Fusarium agapanthi TaxID=1803897 RepID=A0A9P5B4F0_9HYPO|nr:C6 zinc finger domain containing protein [Fusarium agapanthi]